MKRAFLLIIFTMQFASLDATVEVGDYFSKGKVRLMFEMEMNSYRKVFFKEYSTRVTLLNEYFIKKIESKEIEDKNLNILVHTTFYSGSNCRFEISQNKNGFFIDTTDFLNLSELAAIIEYFSMYKESFVVKRGDCRFVEKMKARFFEKILRPDIKDYLNRKIEIWAQDELKLEFHNDKLRYLAGENEVPVKPNNCFPVKVGDKFLMFENDCFIVLQGKKIIKRISVNGSIYFCDYKPVARKKWVDIFAGRENPIYSYSLENNRFYDLTEK